MNRKCTWRKREASPGKRHCIARAPPILLEAPTCTAASASLVVAHESAIRGLDLPEVELVLITMAPDSPESYMHMAGRTGRFGRRGEVVSILTPRELSAAGVVTASLRGVKFRTRRWIAREEALEETSGAPEVHVRTSALRAMRRKSLSLSQRQAAGTPLLHLSRPPLRRT